MSICSSGACAVDGSVSQQDSPPGSSRGHYRRVSPFQVQTPRHAYSSHGPSRSSPGPSIGLVAQHRLASQLVRSREGKLPIPAVSGSSHHIASPFFASNSGASSTASGHIGKSEVIVKLQHENQQLRQHLDSQIDFLSLLQERLAQTQQLESATSTLVCSEDRNRQTLMRCELDFRSMLQSFERNLRAGLQKEQFQRQELQRQHQAEIENVVEEAFATHRILKTELIKIHQKQLGRMSEGCQTEFSLGWLERTRRNRSECPNFLEVESELRGLSHDQLLETALFLVFQQHSLPANANNTTRVSALKRSTGVQVASAEFLESLQSVAVGTPSLWEKFDECSQTLQGLYIGHGAALAAVLESSLELLLRRNVEHKETWCTYDAVSQTLVSNEADQPYNPSQQLDKALRRLTTAQLESKKHKYQRQRSDQLAKQFSLEAQCSLAMAAEEASKRADCERRLLKIQNLFNELAGLALPSGSGTADLAKAKKGGPSRTEGLSELEKIALLSPSRTQEGESGAVESATQGRLVEDEKLDDLSREDLIQLLRLERKSFLESLMSVKAEVVQELSSLPQASDLGLIGYLREGAPLLLDLVLDASSTLTSLAELVRLCSEFVTGEDVSSLGNPLIVAAVLNSTGTGSGITIGPRHQSPPRAGAQQSVPRRKLPPPVTGVAERKADSFQRRQRHTVGSLHHAAVAIAQTRQRIKEGVIKTGWLQGNSTTGGGGGGEQSP